MGLPVKVKLYIVLISLLAALIIAHFAFQLFQLWDLNLLQAFIIFGVLVFLTEIYEVELTYKRMTSTAIAVCLATLLLGGALLAITVTLIGTLMAEIILRWGRLAEGLMNFIWRVSFNTGQLILSIFAASLVFSWLGGRPLIVTGLAGTDLAFYNQIIPALGAFVAFALVNNFLVAGVITLTQRTSLIYHLMFDIKHLMVQLLSLGVLGVLMAVVYAQSPWNLLLVLIPLGLVHVSLRSYMKLRHETKKTFESIVEMLHARDPYTYEHSKDVAELATAIAQKLKLHQDQVEQIRSAALIHDIGKLGVPDSILRKPGPLTEDEWRLMKKHPDIGADLIKELEIYRDIVDIIRYEHERWDGSGYPKGLKGEEIPIGARVVAAADIYHALTTERPYRPAYSHEEALRMIQGMRGEALDPQVVDALLSVLEEARAKEPKPSSQEKAPH